MKLTALLTLLAGLFLPTLLSAQEAVATNSAPSLFSPEVPAGSPAAASPSVAGTNSPSSDPTPVTNTPAEAPVAPAPEAASNGAVADPLTPPADSGMGSPGQNPPPSDPNSLIPPPTDPETPSPVNTAGNEEKERQDQKARYYAAKVKADKEEALADLLEKSDKAKSDEGRRQTLREYYDLLARRMKRIDPSISGWIDTMHAAYLRRIEQARIEPTIPQTPPPAPEGSPSTEETPRRRKGHTQPVPESIPAAKVKAESKADGKPASVASPSPKASKKDPKTPAAQD